MDWKKLNEARALANTLRVNPKTGLTSLGIGVIAPRLIQNDDRGYVESALITTPLVAAGTAAYGRVSAALSKEKPSMVNFFREMPSRFSTSKLPDYQAVKLAQAEYAKGNIRTSIFNKTLGDFYLINRKAKSLDGDIQALQGNAARLFGPYTNMPARQRYLENVIHQELLNSLPTGPLAAYKNKISNSPVAPVLGQEGISNIIQEQTAAGNGRFAKAMNFHIGRMQDMNYSGNVFLGSNSPINRIKSTSYSNLDWNETDNFFKFKSAHPELAQAIDSQIKAGRINPDKFKLVQSGDQFVGFRYGKLKASIVGQDGRIFSGANWDKTGVSRGIFTLNGKYRSDIFAVNNIGTDYKLLKADLQRAYLINGVESDDFNGVGMSSGESAIISDREARIKSRQYIASDALGFQGNKGASSLGAEQVEGVIDQLDGLGLTKTGSESGLGKLVFEDKSLLGLNYYGIQDPTRQDAIMRSMSKRVTLSNIPKDANHAPYALTDELQQISNGDVPSVGIRVGGVSAEQRTFFANLPERVEDLAGHEMRAIEHLTNKHMLSGDAARSIWRDMQGMLGNQENLTALRKLGYMGEGSKILRSNGMSVSYMRNFTVHETPFDASNIGQEVGKGPVGFRFGAPVTSDGSKNTLKAITQNTDGTTTLGVEVSHPLGMGAKIDLDAAKRGLVGQELSSGEMNRVIGGINKYNQLTGSGPKLTSDVDALNLHYMDVGKGNPVYQTVNDTSAVMRKMRDLGQTDIVDKYEGLLGDQGFLADHTMIFESAWSKKVLTSRNKSVAAFESLVEVSNQLMGEAGARLQELSRTNPGVLNESARNFVASGMDLRSFMSIAESPQNMMAWSHTLMDQSNDVKLTYDMTQNLYNRGFHGAAKDLLERSEVDGNLSHNIGLAKYLDSGKGIDKTMTVREAAGRDPSSINLSTPKGQQGSLFDLSREDTKGNFLMKLSNGQSVPVLGSEGYLGGTNRYDVGMTTPTDMRRALKNVMTADKGGGEALEAAVGNYNSELQKYVNGKKSFLRADAYDPLAVGGFLQNRTAANPWEVGLSKDYVGKIKSKQIRDALLSGEEVTGTLARYPVSYMPFVSYKLDDNLKNGAFGIHEDLTPFIHGDFDQDRAYAYFFEHGSNGHEDALKAMAPGGDQERDFNTLRQIEKDTIDELPGNFTGGAKSFEDRTKKLLGDVMRTPEVFKNRLASRTIGEYSNTYSAMRTALAHNTQVTDVAERATLDQMFFNIYQSPISAAKAKAGQALDLQSARYSNRALAQSLEGSYDEFKESLTRVMSFASGSAQEAIASSDDLLRRYHSGITQDALQMGKALTNSNMSSGGKVFGSVADSVKAADMLPYLRTADKTFSEASTGAKMASEAVGAINETASAWKSIAKAGRESGAIKYITAGLGAAAAVGLLRTNIGEPRAMTPERRRPEVAQASSDAIPGEPVSGSYSSNPPKTQATANGSPVNSIMVAPIHQSNDVEVSLRTDDRSRQAQTNKIIAKLANTGNTTVTNNYKGNTNLKSLRTRQKIRDAMDQT